MSGPTRPEMDAYTAELRAYRVRLAQWLGLSIHEVFELDEEKTDEESFVHPPGLRVTWTATAPQQARRGRDGGLGRSGSGEDPIRYFGAVNLDFQLLRDMRAVVGERPEMLGLKEARRAFGIA